MRRCCFRHGRDGEGRLQVKLGAVASSGRRGLADGEDIPEARGRLEAQWEGQAGRAASVSERVSRDGGSDLDSFDGGRMRREIARLEQLLLALGREDSLAGKSRVLRGVPGVAEVLEAAPGLERACVAMGAEAEYVILCVAALGQAHVLGTEVTSACTDQLSAFVGRLMAVDRFADTLGGIVGYQCVSLMLIFNSHADALEVPEYMIPGTSTAHVPDACPVEMKRISHATSVRYLAPEGRCLATDSRFEAESAAWGLRNMGKMGEMYPLGGAGDRLGLKCEYTGEDLPTALLPYAGFTLLECLVRDLQAREYLAFRCLGSGSEYSDGQQPQAAVALMTSHAKGNHRRIMALLEEKGYFGRGADAFRVFPQPSVPVLAAADGAWLARAPFDTVMKPGGHGAVWKLAAEAGVFEWMRGRGHDAFLVRQISNPMAGQDATLLSLAGAGVHEGRTFGFASCKRRPGATEGVNVLRERSARCLDGSGSPKYSYAIGCVEYTELERLGLEEKHETFSHDEDNVLHSPFPANTNVLFARVDAIEAATAECPAPGMIINTEKVVRYTSEFGGERRDMEVLGGRLECCMQDIALSFASTFERPLAVRNGRCEGAADLETFVLYNDRRKVTSSAKRRFEAGKKMSQTPEGSHMDLLRNAWDLLANRCGFDMPSGLDGTDLAAEEAAYLAGRVPFLVHYHPALGPLYDVISQKVRGGRMAPGAELHLEVAEADVHGLDLEGSLCVVATGGASLGRTDPATGLLHYGDQCARVRLSNVAVANAGVNYADESNVLWAGRVARTESCTITLEERSEFDAQDVTLAGNLSFHVPAGCRLTVTDGGNGHLRVEMSTLGPDEGPSWTWNYTLLDGDDVHPDGRRGPVALTLVRKQDQGEPHDSK